MSEARDRILSAARAALGRRVPPDAAAISAEAARLVAGPDRGRPPRSGTLTERFIERLTDPKVGGTVARIAALADLPAAVRAYLAAQNLPADIAVPPDPRLQALDWSGIATHARIGTDEAVAVGLAAHGIAESGSLVFQSGPTSPTLFAFLPLHHIVALATASLLEWLEDYAAGPAAGGRAQPRNVNIITGASGTTDIEGRLVRGAHGPAFLHVVLFGG
jgi:L-lactate dehydrogenase complex protein LldG